ncbi:hypothetical protein HT136_03415 [Novosphingobium profundi]|uniref:PIN domain-containing protein n=1 Tax=Novosphingobium profundi TaxID=1774954 RepID=UPI001BDAD84C|nr:tetratricopeptide repeat protein [Novosphingobium profundi]MBT0667414.1 hypothetical protein [Novosphingobium profundi]
MANLAAMQSSNVIGIPESSEVFEDRCATLFQHYFNDAGVKGVATSGADQQGIDLIGHRDGDPRRPVAVQCKLKKRNDPLSVQEARSDIVRALAIEPQLAEIYVVTTGNDTLALDNLVTQLRQEQADLGRSVEIHIWGWNELQRRIRQYPQALHAFDPEYSASTDELLGLGRAGLNLGQDVMSEVSAARSDQQVMASDVQQILAIVRGVDMEPSPAMDKVLDQQIDSFRDLLNRGRPDTAATMLSDLEDRLPATASPSVRARIKANLGFARMRQGRDKEAAAFFRAAYAITPEDRKARANLALGLLLEGQFAEALARCRCLLEEDRGDTLSAAYAYQAAAMGKLSANPEAFVPEELHSDENVAIHRLNLLRQNDDAAWRTSAADLLEAHPDSGVAQRLAAEALLEEGFGGLSLHEATLPESDVRARIERAAALLQAHWDEVRLYENAGQPVWAGVGVNLVAAYRSLQRFDDACRSADQVLAVAPALPEALIARAHLDVLEDAPAKAIERVRDLPESAARTMAMLVALCELADWPALLAFASAERRSALRVEDRAMFDTMRARGRIGSGASQAEAELHALLADWPGDAAVLGGAARMACSHAPELAKAFLAQLLDRLWTQSPKFMRVMAAETAVELDDTAAVIAALDGHIASDHLSPPLLWLAWAFANAPVTPRTRQFFDEIAPDVIALPQVARLAGAAADARGDIAGAERHLKQTLAASPEDLRARIMLYKVYLRADRKSAADELVRTFDETTAVGCEEDKMRLAQTLRYAGEDTRAFELAYTVASHHRGLEEVVQMYPGLFFASDRLPEALQMDRPAQIGDWFRLEDLGGGKDVSGLLSATATPEVVNYPPDQPLAMEVLGRKVGDRIVVAQGIGAARQYCLRELKHRYVWLLHDILHTHATRFPQSRSMGSLTLQGGDVKPVLDMVREHHEHSVDICRAYNEASLPLQILAALNHVSVLQIAELVPQHGGEIRTCLASPQERDAAHEACLHAKGHGIVLDTLTAWCAYHFDLLEPMRAFFGPLTISQRTIDELVEMRAREEIHLGREYMTIGYVGSEAVRQVHTPEETQKRVAMFSRTVEALTANCEVLPAEGADDDQLARLVHREIVEGILDPMLLARQTGRLLVSDDLHLRQLAVSLGFAQGAWLQAAARAMVEVGVIDMTLYALTVARLASRRHGHVWLDADILIELLKHEHGKALIETVSGYIGGPSADIAAHCHVVADFMNKAWDSGVVSWRAQAAASILITRLISKRADWWDTLDRLFHTFARAGGRGVRKDLSQIYLQDWQRGHFLRRPGTASTQRTSNNRSKSRRNPDTARRDR